ncbi:universal stress protein [Natranaerofaba carboxydovora]|uniref:universal stress protein n=1 Tax=Natranaerofaba carboxydovora TaxID=2742683 RepID=UPI001F132080|nr:universal stress protein [Natranaerofaba carboxydovora]UMZ73753.1 Universal stress protein [Natranaerofaba carboxydovora]
MNILVCTDGSEQSFNAIKKTAKIAENLKEATISILFVFDPAPLNTETEGLSISRVQTIKSERGQEVLEQAEELLNKYNINIANKIVREGHPVNEITDEVSQNNYDLVVIGNRGIGRIQSMFLGSVSSAVAQEAKTDVMIVKK